MNKNAIIAVILLCAAYTEAAAQNGRRKFWGKLDSILTTHYFNPAYDTNYVTRPAQRWMLRFMVNQAGNHIHAKGTVNDVWSKYDLHTRRNTSLSFEVNYCNLSLTLTVTPAKIFGDYDDTEFHFEYQGQKLAFDFNYQRSTSLSGDIQLGSMDHLDEDGLSMNEINVTCYYTFNHRHFSFPAALSQNVYQCRSAGSPLAGINFQGGSIKTTQQLKERSPLMPDMHLKALNVALGLGYGYNLVLGKRSQWLFHLSALPSFVVYKHNRLTLNGNKKRDQGLCFNMIFNERAAIVYHFSPRYFAGASFLMSNSIYDNDNINIKQNHLRGSAIFGLRL